MADRDEFGPHLRSARMQRGITLAQLTRATNVSADLWEALERNDLSRWPGGIFARAYVRAYAVHVGLDPEKIIDEFCRCFPAGDRRTGRIVREQAALLGHDTTWRDEVGHGDADRRMAEVTKKSAVPALLAKGGRPLAAIGDAAAVLLLSTTAAFALRVPWSAAAAVCALGYHGGAVIVLGSTPAVWAIDTYLMNRRPGDRRAVFLKLLKSP